MCENSEESAPRQEHKLLSPSEVNTFGICDIFFFLVDKLDYVTIGCGGWG